MPGSKLEECRGKIYSASDEMELARYAGFSLYYDAELRYSGYTSWEAGSEVFAQYNYLWFDAENQVWETDAPMKETAATWAAVLIFTDFQII